MITFKQVTKRFGAQDVLLDVNLQVNPGERVAIVGPNGAGKTTVFSLITGDMSPDQGRVIVPSDMTIGYVHQQINAREITGSILEYTENAIPEVQSLQVEMDKLQENLRNAAAGGGSDLKRLGELQTRFEQLGGYTVRNQAEQALGGLGFSKEAFHAPLRSLSGGWQSRAELARVLVAKPDILLLDEPSNYLDIPAIEWMEGFLNSFRGTLLLISHDRHLINTLTRVTIEIANARAERYSGNYEFYARERELRYAQRLAALKNQEKKRKKLEDFVERFKAKNAWSSQAQSRMKMLERMDEIELPHVAQSPGKITLRPPPHCGNEIIRLDGAGLTYDRQRWVLRNLDLRIQRGEKLALVGYNGLGKTTLLRMLGGSLPLSEGRRVLGHKVVIGYQSQDFAETMDPDSTVYGVVKNMAPDASDLEVRTLLGGFGFSGNFIEKKVRVLSGGEKIRLAFARLLINPPSFLLLDEPTTHLDIQAREALEGALAGCEGTLCVVSHDIDFTRRVASGIIAMTPPGITRYPGGLDYYHEKTAQAQAASVALSVGAGKGAVSLKAESNNVASTTDRRELRRQRAQARQALHEKTRDFKKIIAHSEERIAALEAERKLIIEQLAVPDPSRDIAALGKRLVVVEEKIKHYTDEWDRATEALQSCMDEK